MSIKIMIVDDSAVVRETLRGIFEEEPDFEVLATAADPLIAAKKLETMVPDVITLDIEMPRLDGLSFLKVLMAQHPLPVVICSSQSGEGSLNALKALEYGAAEIIRKPMVGTKLFLQESRTEICDAIRAAYCAGTRLAGMGPRPRTFAQGPAKSPEPKLSADAILAPAKENQSIDTTDKIVVIGASTGGTEALREYLEALPADAPATVIVQHMPEHFTRAFAQRLDGLCKVEVKEAQDNDSVLRGRVLIAPGNHHCLLKRSGARYYVEIKDGPLVSRHRPSVDVLFRSAARYAGKNAVGIIMTGMGDDGAKGMRELFEAGAWTIAQDESSCVVFGMPKEAIKLGACHEILPLGQLANAAMQRVRKMGG